MGETLAITLYLLGVVLAMAFVDDDPPPPTRTWRDTAAGLVAAVLWPPLVLVGIVLGIIKGVSKFRASTTLHKE